MCVSHISDTSIQAVVRIIGPLGKKTPPTFNCLTSMKGYIFVNFFNRINNADLFLQPSLLIFTKGANNSDHDCIYTILPKVLAPLLMNRFDYFSNFYEYKS